MGKKFSILRENIFTANKLFSSQAFFEVTGCKLHLTFTGRAHHFRVSKNVVSVTKEQAGNPSQLIGYISLKDILSAIRIAEYIIGASNLKSVCDGEDSLCCICLDQPIDSLLICGHGYCEKDIMDWWKRDSYCPMCRQTINTNKMYTSLDSVKDIADIEQSMEELFKLISL